MQTQLEPTKKSHRILVLILVILLTAGVIGGGVYYVLNQQMKKQDKLIEELQKKPDKLSEESSTGKEKKTEEKSTKLKYTNSQYGFELDFQDSWKEYGTEDEIIEGTTKVIYFGLPRKELNQTFDMGFLKYYDSPFAISIYTKTEWDIAQNGEMVQVAKLGEKGNYIFGWSQGNGTINVKGVTQEQALLDIKDIIKTFKIID